jgi:subtilase family serine protease
MKPILSLAFCLTLALSSVSTADAQTPRNNPGLPKVDFVAGQISKVGQAVSINVTNRGFVRSPSTTVSVAVWDMQRRLIMTKSLNVTPLQPNQTTRVLFVPPNPSQQVMVRATVDPGNRIPETNERNNVIAGRP